VPKINSEKFYTQAIKRYGTTPQGLNWNSKLSQTLRFEVILELLQKEIAAAHIVDAGCGFGDFYLYLRENSISCKSYTGIDELETMCRIAREKTQQEILQANIINDTLVMGDFYICSGALNVLTKFETYAFVQNCYKHAARGFIFNILFGEKQSDIYNYFTMQEIQSLAKDLGVKKMQIQQDYLENDITVGFFK